MISRLRFPALLTLLLLLAVPAAAVAQDEAATEPKTLYDRMLDITRREHMVLVKDARLAVEPAVAEYLAAMNSTTPEKINDLLNGGIDLCEEKELDVVGECPEFAANVQTIADRETHLRALARDLQIDAWSFFDPLLGVSAAPFSSRAEGIARMWMADGAKIDDHAASAIRSVSIPEDPERTAAMSELGDALEALRGPEQEGNMRNEDWLTAAVWRDRLGGLRWRRGMRPDLPPHADEPDATATDRELITGSFLEEEDKLIEIWDVLAASTADIPLQPGETALVDFPESDFENLPDNIRVWAYLEELKNGTRTGDIGLEFIDAVEPVMPTLCASTDAVNGSDPTHGALSDCAPALGGAYGPPPKNNESTGLCNNPLMRDGDLCADLPSDSPEDCTKQLDIDGSTELTTCIAKKPEQTDAGGGIGMDSSWIRSQEPIEPSCTVKLQCGPESFDARTAPKNENNEVIITMNEHPNGSPVHLMLHELTHAQQICAGEANADPYEGANTPEAWTATCCDFEGDAYRTQCQAMLDDGVFENTPYTVETCTHILTDFSCRERRNAQFSGDENAGACPWSYTFGMTTTETTDLAHAVMGSAEAWLQEHNAGASPADRSAETCSEIVDPPDGEQQDVRIAAAVRDIGQDSADVCTPNRETGFLNSIGNTLLFINRCWLQTLQKHRIIPTKTPLGAGETAFAFEMCMRPDPQLGAVLRGPQEPGWIPPPYRPEMLVQHIEETFCPGYPPGDPVCPFPLERRLDLPVTDLLSMGSDLADQPGAFEEESKMLQQFGEAVGSRIGNRLYAGYVSQRARALTEVLTAAAADLQELTKATFADQVCPLNDAGDDSLLDSDACGLNVSSSSSETSSSESPNPIP